MQTRIWNFIERISTLLEPDERHSALGDIQERGATIPAALDLTGLVLLRQLQSWKSWRPWLLAAALYYPASYIGFLAFMQADTLYLERYRLTYYPGSPVLNLLASPHLDYWEGIGTAILAWTAGFTLGSFGHRRAASLLPLALAFIVWSNYRLAVIHYPSGAGLIVAMLAAACLAMIPCLLGFLRGFQQRPLHPVQAILLAAFCIGAHTRAIGLTLPLAFWPLLCLLASSRSRAKRVIQYV